MKKTKRQLWAGLAIALSVTTASNLTACFNPSQSESTHTHTFGAWTLSKGEDNCNGGTFERICTECTELESRIGTEADHAWAQTYQTNSTHHWLLCTYCGVTSGEETHEEDGAGLCRDCQYLLPTQCVYYELSSDSSYAIVTGYDEAETDVIVIADRYEGVPVKEIQANAFEGCTSLERVVLPNTITTIGENAFYDCKRLSGIYLSLNVTTIGDNAFHNCPALTIFTERTRDNLPTSWSETWNTNAFVVWNYFGKTASNVSAKSTLIVNSVFTTEKGSSCQLIPNNDTSGVKAPDGFSIVNRYDSKTTPPGTPWTEGNLWYYNWNPTKLTDYSEVWFAIKAENAFWAFVHEGDKNRTPASWAYIHMKQTGETEDGFTAWKIEFSIGGYVYSTIVDQTGRYIDDDRPTNSIPRLLWDEGFGSPDKNGMLIYLHDSNFPVTLYCTEVRGIKTES